MPSKKTLSLVGVILVAGFLTNAATTFAASKERVVHSFSGKDGFLPYAGLIFDADGNLYGTTEEGATPGQSCENGCGTVFELTPGAGGKWTETMLHRFKHDGKDGWSPRASLAFDAAGNLYGTTFAGGTNGSSCGGWGCGTVFELRPGAGGKWTETVLYSFAGSDGLAPWTNLIFDGAGNLYGTTLGGGAHNCDFGVSGCGTVFELTPGANDTWTETVLYSFAGSDGANPYAGLVFDAAGNLYGTTSEGGAYTFGTVFELVPGANGTWAETVLHSFARGSDGAVPYAGLVFDAAGNLYGTTYFGGAPTSYGTVFELTPGAGGKWTETLLRRFSPKGQARYPSAGLIFDSLGNLYGTTSMGSQGGTVFELTPGTGGEWTETVLHYFSHISTGHVPTTSLTSDTSGNLYGATLEGGRSSCGGPGCGVVFEITP